MKLDKAQLLLDEQPSRSTYCSRNTPRGTRRPLTKCAGACARARTGREAGNSRSVGTTFLRRHGRWLSFRAAASIRPPKPASAATLINCFVHAGRRRDQRPQERRTFNLSRVEPGPRNDAAAAAASAMTSRRSGPRARWCTAALARQRADSYMRCSTRAAKRSNPPAHGARADGDDALRPSGHRGIQSTPSATARSPLQHVGAVTDEFHACGRHGRGPIELWHAAGALRQVRGLPAGTADTGAAGSIASAQRARDLFDQIIAVELQPRRAGRNLRRPRQRRQQPVLLRDDSRRNNRGET